MEDKDEPSREGVTEPLKSSGVEAEEADSRQLNNARRPFYPLLI